MIEMNAYDTICHEHLEYYGARQMRWMMERSGLKIVGLERNAINGGSFSLTVAKKSAPYPECSKELGSFLRAEESYAGLAPYRAFAEAVAAHREELRAFFARARPRGRRSWATEPRPRATSSCKYCGLTEKDVPFVGEVNADKSAPSRRGRSFDRARGRGARQEARLPLGPAVALPGLHRREGSLLPARRRAARLPAAQAAGRLRVKELLKRLVPRPLRERTYPCRERLAACPAIGRRARALLARPFRERPIGDLTTYEKRFRSQNGEDGIIEAIFAVIGVTNRFFVEFGVEDGRVCNTRRLRERGWTGLRWTRARTEGPRSGASS